MKNVQTNVGSFATVKLQAKRRSLLTIALMMATVFSMAALGMAGCDTEPGLTIRTDEPGPAPVVPTNMADGPKRIAGDIQFNINPDWTNEQANKAVSQALRHMTAEAEELLDIYTRHKSTAEAEQASGNPNFTGTQAKIQKSNAVIPAENAIISGLGRGNIAGVKASVVPALENLERGIAGKPLDALKRASYIAARTNMTPQELADAKEDFDVYLSSLEAVGLPKVSRENPIPQLKTVLNEKLSTQSYPGELTNARYKLITQYEDYGQFEAFADDLMSMGHTLNNLSNRSARFVIEDNYQEEQQVSRGQE